MNKVQKIVEYYTKKVLAEYLKAFEKLIENKIEERLSLISLLQEGQSSNLNTMQQQHHERSEPVVEMPKRKITPEMLGITEGVWKNVYEDTAQSSSPILTGKENDVEMVPEHLMEQAGLMRDYSKFLPKKQDKKALEESQDIEMKRKEMLSRTIIRHN